MLVCQRCAKIWDYYLQRSCPSDYIRHIHHAFIIIFETRYTGLIMASLNVLVKLLPSSPFRLFLFWDSSQFLFSSRTMSAVSYFRMRSFSFFVCYAYFVLCCLVFVLSSFIHAESVHEFNLLACCYSRWVF